MYENVATPLRISLSLLCINQSLLYEVSTSICVVTFAVKRLLLSLKNSKSTRTSDWAGLCIVNFRITHDKLFSSQELLFIQLFILFYTSFHMNWKYKKLKTTYKIFNWMISQSPYYKAWMDTFYRISWKAVFA